MSWLDKIVNTVAPIAGAIVSGPVGSAISVGSAAIQHITDKDWSSEEAQANRDFQVSERLAAQEWNERMWRMNNDYNSPLNQLKLYEDAGINPNAVFGNLNAKSNGSPSTAAMSGSSAPGVPSFANSMLSLSPEIQNLQANTRKTEAEAEGQEIANDNAPKFNDAMLRKAISEADAAAAKAGLDNAQAQQIKELLPFLKGKNESEIRKLEEETKVLIEQISLVKSQADSAEKDAEMKRLDLEFRNKFGVAPGSGLVDGIIQLIGSGEKGANIANSLVTTLANLAVGLFTGQFTAPVKVIRSLAGF